MKRYLNNALFPMQTYKNRLHYEMILTSTGSVEISHNNTSNSNKSYFSFSKMIIKKIILPDEWGLSTLKDCQYIHPIQKMSINYNYWDYVEAFSKTLFYENDDHKHSWFIKICAQVFKSTQIPSWFIKWWSFFGPSQGILPVQFKELYHQWVEISPRIMDLDKEDRLYPKTPIMNFFMEFSVPWIYKWTIELGKDSDEVPCLFRRHYTKFWPKLISKGSDGKMVGQELLDTIKTTITKYDKEIPDDAEMEESHFRKITKKIQIKKGGTLSKEELIAAYMEQIKKDIQKQITDDDVLMGDNFEDSQSVNSITSEDLPDLLKKAEEEILKIKKAT